MTPVILSCQKRRQSPAKTKQIQEKGRKSTARKQSKAPGQSQAAPFRDRMQKHQIASCKLQYANSRPQHPSDLTNCAVDETSLLVKVPRQTKVDTWNERDRSLGNAWISRKATTLGHCKRMIRDTANCREPPTRRHVSAMARPTESTQRNGK